MHSLIPLYTFAYYVGGGSVLKLLWKLIVHTTNGLSLICRRYCALNLSQWWLEVKWLIFELSKAFHHSWFFFYKEKVFKFQAFCIIQHSCLKKKKQVFFLSFSFFFFFLFLPPTVPIVHKIENLPVGNNECTQRLHTHKKRRLFIIVKVLEDFGSPPASFKYMYIILSSTLLRMLFDTTCTYDKWTWTR